MEKSMFVQPEQLKKELEDLVSPSILSIGLGCEAKYAKFVYSENLNLNDKATEIPIGVSCKDL